jgi:hypothetical protein
MIVLNPFAAKPSARSYRASQLQYVEGVMSTYLVVHKLEAEEVREEENDLVFGVVDRGGRDVARDATDRLDLARWRALMLDA